MKYDFRAVEAKAAAMQEEVTNLTSKPAGERTPEDELRIVELMGRINECELQARDMRDAELEELRGLVATGVPVGGSKETESERAIEAFAAYLRTGQEITDASLSYTDANGGYIVPEPAHADLIEKIRKSDAILGRATYFPLSGDPSIVLPYKASHGVVATATETGARTEQNAPTFTGPTITCADYYSDQRATQLWVDSVNGSETMLMQWMYEDIWEQAGADACVGAGPTSNALEGLFTGTTKYQTRLSGVAGALSNANFLATYFALPVKYRANAVWIMSGSTLAVVAAMGHPAASTTIPLATQDQNTGAYKILGKEVAESDSAPAIGAANFPVAFADVQRAYAYAVHRTPSVLRDPFTATPKVRYYSLARIGGAPWDYQAAILLKSNNT